MQLCIYDYDMILFNIIQFNNLHNKRQKKVKLSTLILAKLLTKNVETSKTNQEHVVILLFVWRGAGFRHEQPYQSKEFQTRPQSGIYANHKTLWK